jgi:probable HAF family extracellular repeat protein
MKQLSCGLMVLALFLGMAGQGKAQPTYVFTSLDPPGSTGTRIFGINDRGQIVGVFGDAFGKAHGFLLDSGTYTTLDVPGAQFTEALTERFLSVLVVPVLAILPGYLGPTYLVPAACKWLALGEADPLFRPLCAEVEKNRPSKTPLRA